MSFNIDSFDRWMRGVKKLYFIYFGRKMLSDHSIRKGTFAMSHYKSKKVLCAMNMRVPTRLSSCSMSAFT